MLARGFHIWLSSSLTSVLFVGLMLSGTSALATDSDSPGTDHEHRKSSVGKAWVVADPALPEETLLAKLAEGEVVRVLHDGRSWDRVEVIDTGRTTGWVLKRLFESATSEELNQAIEARRGADRRARRDAARRDLEFALEDEAKARVATAKELDTQDGVQALVREAKQRVDEAHSTWRRVTAQVQKARNLVGSLRASEPAMEAPMAPAPSPPLLVRPSEPLVQVPGVTVQPVIEEAVNVAAVAAQEAADAPSPSAPRVHPPSRVSAPAPQESRDRRSSATAEIQAASTTDTESPQPPTQPAPLAASTDPVRHPSTPETSSGTPSKAAGVSLVSPLPPTAIIGHRPATAQAVTVGAGGVTLGGALIALVMLAGLGGFGGWWRRRHGDSDPSMAMRLRSLATVAIGKEASVALIGAPGRTLMVGCSSKGVHLVSEMPEGELPASLHSVTSDSTPVTHPSLRQLFPDAAPSPISHRPLENTAPVSQEIQRLAAASRRALGGLT